MYVRSENTLYKTEQDLQARLLSLVPISLQNQFATIHKSRIPDQNQRGRMFEASLRDLSEWWYSQYFEVQDNGHIRSLTYDNVRDRIRKAGYANDIEPPQDQYAPPTSLFSEEALQDILEDDGAEKFRAVADDVKIMCVGVTF